ncbi:MAG: hypothetical protein JWO60_3183, partial [Frankiales bacterium]|nr:hypothetical protein [Frankiales bacterium]
MSAPVFLCEDLAASRIVLDGAEGRHAAGSRRMAPGEAVDLVDGRGLRADCRVVSSGKDTLTLEVVGRTVEPPPAPRFVLVQALPKGDRGELAVELATEVGVDEVVPWVAARCVMQWKGERGDKQRARWQSTAREAAKQARRAWVPQVAELHDTRQVAALLDGGPALVLHEAATEPLTAVELPAGRDVVLVVGPEGGIDEREL